MSLWGRNEASLESSPHLCSMWEQLVSLTVDDEAKMVPLTSASCSCQFLGNQSSLPRGSSLHVLPLYPLLTSLLGKPRFPPWYLVSKKLWANSARFAKPKSSIAELNLKTRLTSNSEFYLPLPIEWWGRNEAISKQIIISTWTTMHSPTELRFHSPKNLLCLFKTDSW